MKSMRSGCLAALLLGLCGPGAAGPPDEKPRIAVLPLKAEGQGRFGERQEDAYDRVAQAFLQTRRFQLVDRNQLSAALGSREVPLDEAGAAALGRRLGARFLVLGSYRGSLDRVVETYASKDGPVYNVFFPARITLNLKLLDVASGQVAESFEGRGASKEVSPDQGIVEAMRDLSVKLNREVINAFPLEGHLVKVLSQSEAVLDLGRRDGVALGDRFLLADPAGPPAGPRREEPPRLRGEMIVTLVQETSSTVRISGKPFPLDAGLPLESAPKKPGFWESIGDTLKK